MKTYEIGDDIELTRYGGTKVSGRIIDIRESALGLQGTAKVFLDSDPANPQLLDSFEEFQTRNLRIHDIHKCLIANEEMAA